MNILIWIFIGLLAAAALACFALAPARGRKRAESWRGRAFAHRGLHGWGSAENSLGAFERACKRGYGIELDVQLTQDGTIVVFHDDDLRRMLGDARRVDGVDFADLRQMRLPDGSAVPTFDEVLALVNGRVPLLVELKNGSRNDLLCRGVLEKLRSYSGAYIIESFNPLIVRWFRRHAPEIIRGQLVSSWENYVPRFSRGLAVLLGCLGLNFLSRPDFVAYDVEADFAAPKLQRWLFGTPMACWTVRKRETYDAAIARGEMPIFEGFDPGE